MIIDLCYNDTNAIEERGAPNKCVFFRIQNYNLIITMTKIEKVVLALCFVFTAFVLVFSATSQNISKPFGSVNYGGEYQGTTTDATWTTLTPVVLKSGTGSLGSIVITTVGTGSLTLYDATTTDVTKRTGATATSTLVLANLQITTTLGTYTFDRNYYNGLIAVWVGTNNASTTITFR